MAIAQTNKRDDIRQHNQRPQDDEEAARQLIESGANIEAEAEEFKMFVSQHINSMSQGAAQASKSVRPIHAALSVTLSASLNTSSTSLRSISLVN